MSLRCFHLYIRLKYSVVKSSKQGKGSDALEVRDVSVVLTPEGDVDSYSGDAGLSVVSGRGVVAEAGDAAVWYWPYCFAPGLERGDLSLDSLSFAATASGSLDILKVSVEGSQLVVRSSDSFVPGIRKAVVQLFSGVHLAYRVSIVQMCQDPVVPVGGVTRLEIDQQHAAVGPSGCLIGRLGPEVDGGSNPFAFTFTRVADDGVGSFVLESLFFSGDPATTWEDAVPGLFYLRLRNVEQSLPVVISLCNADRSGPYSADSGFPCDVTVVSSSLSKLQYSFYLWFNGVVECSQTVLVAVMEVGRIPGWFYSIERSFADPNNPGRTLTRSGWPDWSAVQLRTAVKIYVSGSKKLAGGVLLSQSDGPVRWRAALLDSAYAYSGAVGPFEDATALGSDALLVPRTSVLCLDIPESTVVEDQQPEYNDLYLARLSDGDGLDVTLPLGPFFGFTYYSNWERTEVATSFDGPAAWGPSILAVEWLQLVQDKSYMLQSISLGSEASRMVCHLIDFTELEENADKVVVYFSPAKFEDSEGSISPTSKSLWLSSGWRNLLVPSPGYADSSNARVFLSDRLPYYLYVWLADPEDALLTVDFNLTLPCITSTGDVDGRVVVGPYPTLLPIGEVYAYPTPSQWSSKVPYSNVVVLYFDKVDS